MRMYISDNDDNDLNQTMGNYWAFINNIRVAPKSRDMFGRETDQRDKITNFHHTSGQELTHNRCKPIIDLLPDYQGYTGVSQMGYPQFRWFIDAYTLFSDKPIFHKICKIPVGSYLDPIKIPLNLHQIPPKSSKSK